LDADEPEADALARLRGMSESREDCGGAEAGGGAEEIAASRVRHGRLRETEKRKARVSLSEGPGTTMRPDVEAIVLASVGEGDRREVILGMKHGRYEALSECVGELWAEHAAIRLNAVNAVAVVPIPLHWRRRWRRGYNQAEMLARALASRLHIACDTRWLRRVLPTPKATDVCTS